MQAAQVISCSKLISLHMLQSRQPINIYNPHKGVVNCVHINHTNKVIASCGQDGRIVLVNAQKPDNEVFQTSFNTVTSTSKTISVNCIMFSSYSHYIAAGSSDCLVKIWDMKNHKQVYSTIKSHIGSVNSIAWIKNLGVQKNHGQIIASASSTGDIFLHSVKTSNIVETLNTKNQQGVNQIKVSQSEGHCRLAACTGSGSVMIWNLRNIQKDISPICSFNNGKKLAITSVSFSSFNPVLLATSSIDQTLTFYDVNQKKSVKTITSEEPLTSINFHSDGHTLLAGGMYGGLFVYDLRKPSKPRQKLTGHDSAIKYTVLIKENQLSTSNMAQSRASKTSSVNSLNSVKVSSSRSVKQSEQIKQVKLNNFVQSNRRTQPLNSIVRPDSTKNQIIADTQTKKQTIKLSTTGQQAIKSSQNKASFNKPSSILPNPTSYNYYNKASDTTTIQPSSKTNQMPVLKSNILESDYISTISPGHLSAPSTHLSAITGQHSNSTSYQQKVVSAQSLLSGKIHDSSVAELKQLMEQKFQALHMQLIHQFHLQQRQIKQTLSTLLVQDKRKNEKIKELEAQLKQFRGSSY